MLCILNLLLLIREYFYLFEVFLDQLLHLNLPNSLNLKSFLEWSYFSITFQCDQYLLLHCFHLPICFNFPFDEHLLPLLYFDLDLADLILHSSVVVQGCCFLFVSNEAIVIALNFRCFVFVWFLHFENLQQAICFKKDNQVE